MSQLSISTLKEYIPVKSLPKEMQLDQLGDVICERAVYDPTLNTNIKAYIGDLNQMNWGYLGQGPWNLSLNILYLFSGGDEEFAESNCADFMQEVVSELNHYESDKIEKTYICKWVEKRKNQSKLSGELSDV